FGPGNRFGIRFNGTYRHGDTAIERQAQEIGSATLGLDYRSERLRLSADLGYQKNHMDAPQRPVFLYEDLPIPRPPEADASWSQPWTFVDTESRFYTLRGDVDISDDWVAYAAVGGRKETDYYVDAYPSIQDASGTIAETPFNLYGN